MKFFLACLLVVSFHSSAMTSEQTGCRITSFSSSNDVLVVADTLRIIKIDIAGASRVGNPVNVQRAMEKQGSFYLLQLRNRNPRRRTITVSFYLFDQATGYAMKAADGGYICNPCTYVLDKANRSYEIPIDGLIQSAGRKIAKEMDVFGALLVEGDVDFLVAKTIIRNARGSPFRLSVFSFSREELVQTALE